MMFTGVGFGPSLFLIATGLGRGPLGCCDGYMSRLSTILVIELQGSSENL